MDLRTRIYLLRMGMLPRDSRPYQEIRDELLQRANQTVAAYLAKHRPSVQPTELEDFDF